MPGIFSRILSFDVYSLRKLMLSYNRFLSEFLYNTNFFEALKVIWKYSREKKPIFFTNFQVPCKPTNSINCLILLQYKADYFWSLKVDKQTGMIQGIVIHKARSKSQMEHFVKRRHPGLREKLPRVQRHVYSESDSEPLQWFKCKLVPCESGQFSCERFTTPYRTEKGTL